VTLLALMPVLGFAALAVDIGVLEYAHVQVQSGVDAASLAGVGYLDGTSAGMAKAQEMAITVAGRNQVLGNPLQLTSDDVVLGHYDAGDEHFWATTDPSRVNAVYVHVDVTNLPSIFAGAAFGKMFLDTEAHSLGRNLQRPGAGKTPCFLPIAVPDCYLHTDSIDSYALKMSSAQDDNAGWASLVGNPNASGVKEQLAGQCAQAPATVDMTVYLNNGEISTVLAKVDDMLEHSDQSWDPVKWGPEPPPMDGTGPDRGTSTVHHYGSVIEGPVVVFHPAGGECGSATQFNQDAPVVGFTWGVIYDVDAHGSGKGIRMKLDTIHPYHVDSNVGGGVASNITYTDMNLVY